MNFPRKIILDKIFIHSGLWILLLVLINSIILVSLRISDVLTVPHFIEILWITRILYGIGFVALFVGFVIFIVINFKIIIKEKKKYVLLVVLLIALLFILFYPYGSYSGPSVKRISVDHCTNGPNLTKGVYGGFTLIHGDCMPAPRRTGPCAVEDYVSGKIFFFDVENNQTYTPISNEEGCFEINLPNGEYYLWPDSGWHSGYISENCWKNLSNCTEKEIVFIKGELEYMQEKVCKNNSKWESHSRCNILINDSYFRIDLILNEVVV